MAKKEKTKMLRKLGKSWWNEGGGLYVDGVFCAEFPGHVSSSERREEDKIDLQSRKLWLALSVLERWPKSVRSVDRLFESPQPKSTRRFDTSGSEV